MRPNQGLKLRYVPLTGNEPDTLQSMGWLGLDKSLTSFDTGMLTLEQCLISTVTVGRFFRQSSNSREFLLEKGIIRWWMWEIL